MFMREATLNSGIGPAVCLDQPTLLFSAGEHSVFWLGITDRTAFRCNVYLICDGAEAILIDPGSKLFFPQVRDRVAQIMPPEKVSGMVLCHQDPDVAASMTDWLDLNPGMLVFTSPRTQVLLPHFGRKNFEFHDVSANSRIELPSGANLQFIEAPYLHSPGAFATYDATARCLFSGDIWAALDFEWNLTVQCFDEHVPKMDLFHLDYMGSNLAARGFVKRIEGLAIDAILPQHGSIIEAGDVPAALDYLREIRCGTDIVYAALDD